MGKSEIDKEVVENVRESMTVMSDYELTQGEKWFVICIF